MVIVTLEVHSYSSDELRLLRSTNLRRHVVNDNVARRVDSLGLRNNQRRGKRSGRRLRGWPRPQHDVIINQLIAESPLSAGLTADLTFAQSVDKMSSQTEDLLPAI